MYQTATTGREIQTALGLRDWLDTNTILAHQTLYGFADVAVLYACMVTDATVRPGCPVTAVGIAVCLYTAGNSKEHVSLDTR